MASQIPSQYNSQTVIDAAEAKLRDEGINSAQTVFQSALLDWVDDVTMGDMGDNMDAVRGEIAKLWLAYADLNRRSNMVSHHIFILAINVSSYVFEVEGRGYCEMLLGCWGTIIKPLICCCCLPDNMPPYYLTQQHL